MKIGIDISQIAYEKTGVSEYLYNLILKIIDVDKENKYVLFFSSLRKKIPHSFFKVLNSKKNVEIRQFRFPPSFLDFLWNKLHVFPIEWLISNIDIFISSDWTQPPTINAKNATILYDLIIYKYPNETDKKIVQTQNRRLKWVKKECDLIICISKSTKEDAINLLGIEEKKLKVIYPGI